MSGKPLLAIPVLSTVLLALLGGWLARADRVEVEGRLLDRRYAEAAEGLAGLVEESAGVERERLLYLLGEARLLAGEAEAAADAFARLRREAPLSPWQDKAAFGQAEALARAGRHREAAELLSARVGALVSEERKEQVAGVYLRLAAKVLEGEKPDHVKARGFLDLALGLGLQGALAETVAFRAAEQSLLAKEWKDGIARLEAFLEQWPASARAHQARYRLGEALRQDWQSWRAGLVFRGLARSAAGTEWAEKALWGLGKSFGMPEPAGEEDLVQGVAALRRLIQECPASALAAPASLEIARAWLGKGRTGEAMAEVESLLERFAETPEAAEARFMKGAILRRQGKHAPALKAYRDYLARHPEGGRWKEAQGALVECAYEEAEAARAEGKGSFDRAAGLYRAFLAAYPLDPRSAGTLLLLARMEMERERWQEAMAVLREACARYPGGEEASEAQYLLGEILENRLGDPAGALEEWRRLDWGGWAAKARQAMARLREPSLKLRTERVYRTGEKGRFALESRNIPRVRVRVFRLDLEAYFRASHTTGKIEGLRIEVVEPDAVFQSAVEGYRPMVETRREVELPLGGPGAYVVKVDDGRLEAATLVLVSDLDLIVKASRAGLFVFAQNSREERPQGGARVIVSDGGRILAEGLTGEDGVFRFEQPVLLVAKNLSVFSIAPDGSGATTLDLSGLGAPRGLEARGYVFTDRPAYRPGQEVRVKAVLRDVQAGVYVLPLQKEYTITYLYEGQPVKSEKAALTPFGTLSGRMTLPMESGSGGWVVEVRQASPRGMVFRGGFQVADYQLPQVRCVVEPESPVVIRGEAIAGKVRASWFYGEPLAGEPVTVRLEYAGLQFEAQAVTDAAGVAPFRFETAELAGAREEMVELEAAIPGREVHATEHVLVAGVAMRLGVEIVRDLYLEGESIESVLTAHDRLGRPLGAKLSASLLRRIETRGVLGEIEVARKDAPTSGEDGTARVVFELPAGGRHVLRVSGLDRFGNPVSAEKEIFVSGPEDEKKLRLLVDRERWAAGERLAVRVINRAGKGLALFTSEAEGVFECQPVVLPEGESPYTLELDRRHAPNFRLALARVAGGTLHQTHRDLLVEQALTVEVQPERREAAPFSRLGLDLVARGPAGKPERAELAVAVVDEALLALFPDRREKIEKFFFGGLRAVELRTASSCGFTYEGRTEEVSAELRAEEQRKRALEADEKPSADLSAPLHPGKAEPEDVLGLARKLEAQSRILDDPLAPAEEELEEAIGAGGGFGGRFGGKKGRGGGRMTERASMNAPVFREEFPETALWLPEVLTDAEGRARLEVPVPGSLTTWRILAVGVTESTLVGQGTASFQARKPLLVELELPGRAVAGDRLDAIAVARNHGAQALQVRLEVKDGAGASLGSRELELAPGAGAELPFRLELALAGETAVSAEVRAGEAMDAVKRKIEVLPRGTEHVAWASGVEQGDREVVLELPQGREWRERSLELRIGGRIPGELVRAALQGPEARRLGPAPNTLDRVCKGLGALAALEALRRGVGSEGPEEQRLRALVDGVAGSLCTSFLSGWCYTQWEKTDPGITALAVRFLAGMERLGLGPPAGLLQKGRGVLKGLYPSLDGVGERARVLRALAEAGDAPLEWLGALRRRSAEMDGAGRAALMLAFAAGDRADAGRELLVGLKALARTAPDGGLFWEGEGDPLAATGAAVAAILAVAPGDPEAAKGGRWLQGRRGWNGWASPLGHAAALEALAALEGPGEAGAGTVAVQIKEGVVYRAELGRPEPVVSRLPGQLIGEGPVRLRFSLAGRGRYAWTARLTGWTREPDPSLRNRYLELTRVVTAPPERFQGRAIPAGFAVVSGPVERFENLAMGLPVATTAEVRIRLAPPAGGKFPAGHLVVEELLPAGAALVPWSEGGTLERVHTEAQGGRILFHLGRCKGPGDIRYTLSGIIPGSFQHLPARVYALDRPDEISESAPGSLAVLPRGSARPGPYRRTPDELYHLGLALQEAGEHAAALELLWSLTREWRLEPEPFMKAGRALFELAARAGEPRRLVAAFELLREAWPDLELPLAQAMQAGGAHLALGEFERAGQLFLAVAEASFMKETQVGRTLEAEGEHLEAVERLLGLYYAYPSSPVVRAAMLAVGQELGRRAAALAPGELLGKAGRNDLTARSLQILREFQVLHAEDPMAAEACFSLASGWTSLGRWREALEWAGAGGRRYAESMWRDELRYLEGYALFALGEYERALKALGEVAEGSFPDGTGGRAPSESRWQALFLAGQIHQARGDRGAAEECYGRVADRFHEAARSLEFLRRRSLELPELTRLEPGRAGEVELKWRNLPEAVVRVYKVDLMRLYTLEKSLSGIGGIRLAGIKPHAEERIELRGSGLLDEGARRVALPLEKPGAYLVLAQGGDLLAMGLVLRTALELKVMEDPGAGRVGILVFRSGTPVAGAYVKILGQKEDRFRSGETDLRGAFSAEEISGTATVLVQAGDEYALHRGDVPLLPAKRPEAKNAAPGRKEALDDIQRSNQDLQGRTRGWLDSLFYNQAEGVPLQNVNAAPARNAPPPAGTQAAPGAGESGQADSGKPKPLPRVDLAALAPLEFSPETSEALRAEIGRLVERISDLWTPPRVMGAALKRLKEIGYHGVPAVINLTLKLDYATRDGVQHGAILFMLLKDMCNSTGVEFNSAYNKTFEAEAWENDYDIAWNQNAVKAWHRYWTEFGSSRQLWEEKIAIKRREK